MGSPPPRRIWRLIQRLILLAILAIGTDQALQHTVLADGELRGVSFAPFDPPLFTPTQRSQRDLLRTSFEAGGDDFPAILFDREVGWSPPKSFDGSVYAYDERGARRGADVAERAPDAVRICAVGCSFTRGDEVRGAESWPALLEQQRSNVEAINLGMAGYGLDQALLRLERDGLPLAPDEVWLGWLPRASLRVTTHFPPLLHHWTGLILFKPRYELVGENGLALRPNPVADIGATLELLEDQDALLAAIGDDDPWLQRARIAYAPRGSSWLHASALARGFLTWSEHGGRDVALELEDDASEVRRLVEVLVRNAAKRSRDASARFGLLVLPSRDDLRDARNGSRYWSGVVDSLAASGVRVLDLTEDFVEVNAVDDDEYWMPGGHYSPKANALVATTAAHAWLDEE